ncbi:HTH-type transcriptional regulator SutR [Baekduia alba]|uniref:helix-turn-helix domain-containing protein n=1 Tax=Baekduia alba TaxID=2997333 RepID=UPI002342722E|nr:helix-turn-helix domain-containing protein [Baekduia alba]WCB94509.1 HTH-type transcriptional regulator SutR [Baekduia alba]
MDATAAPPDDDLDALAGRIGGAVRELRLTQRWSLGDLGRAAGLSKTILARIERGEGNPSIETLWRVSRALDVPLGSLISPPTGPRARAIPARSGEPIPSEGGMDAWLLHVAGHEHRSEMYDIELPRGTDQRTDTHLAGTEELIVCVKGRVRVGPYEQEIEIGPGDAAWFTADVAHHYVALRDTRALVWMIYPATAGSGSGAKA